MYNKSRKHNREVAKQNWKKIVSYMSYKSKVKLVNPYNTSSTCPLCRDNKAQRGKVVKCKRCGLTLDRQLCGAINVYFKILAFQSQAPSIVHV